MIHKKYGYNYSTTENTAPLSIINNLGSLSVTTGKINEETTFESINGETLVSIAGEEIVSIL